MRESERVVLSYLCGRHAHIANAFMCYPGRMVVARCVKLRRRKQEIAPLTVDHLSLDQDLLLLLLLAYNGFCLEL
jgi:hypothetical protein